MAQEGEVKGKGGDLSCVTAVVRSFVRTLLFVAQIAHERILVPSVGASDERFRSRPAKIAFLRFQSRNCFSVLGKGFYSATGRGSARSERTF